jgi:hypothetical protein
MLANVMPNIHNVIYWRRSFFKRNLFLLQKIWRIFSENFLKINMASNKPIGDSSHKRVAKGRSQSENARARLLTKRNTKDGEFMNVKNYWRKI